MAYSQKNVYNLWVLCLFSNELLGFSLVEAGAFRTRGIHACDATRHNQSKGGRKLLERKDPVSQTVPPLHRVQSPFQQAPGFSYSLTSFFNHIEELFSFPTCSHCRFFKMGRLLQSSENGLTWMDSALEHLFIVHTLFSCLYRTKLWPRPL